MSKTTSFVSITSWDDLSQTDRGYLTHTEHCESLYRRIHDRCPLPALVRLSDVGGRECRCLLLGGSSEQPNYPGYHVPVELCRESKEHFVSETYPEEPHDQFTLVKQLTQKGCFEDIGKGE